MYFEESQARQFFSMLADNFTGGEIVFDVVSKLSAFFFVWNIRKMGIPRARAKWAIKNANKMTKWDNRITVIDQFPFQKHSEKPRVGHSNQEVDVSYG